MSGEETMRQVSSVSSNLSAASTGTVGGTQFQDLKALLKNLEEEGELGDKPPPFAIQERIHTLCRKFLGGSWKDVPIQDLIIERMTGGMSNMLFLCQLPKHFAPRKSEPDKTLLRVYFNPETESHLVAESVIFTLLSERALGPRLFGIFNGGRLEEYIVSRTLTCAEIGDQFVSRRIAKKLARVHGLSVPIEKDGEYLIDALQRWLAHLLELVSGELRPLSVKDKSGKVATVTAQLLEDELTTVRFLHNVLIRRSADLDRIPLRKAPTVENGDPRIVVDETASVGVDSLRAKLGGAELTLTMDELAAEAHLLKRCISRSHSPVVFCHNDLQEGNILLPRGKMSGPVVLDGDGGSSGDDPKFRKRLGSVYEKDLVLIDFEYASYNYRGFDFANHFCEMGIDYTLKKAPFFTIHPSNFPGEEAQRIFFQAYREGQAEIEGSTEKEVQAAKVDKLMKETRPFVAVSHFFWGVWALLQLEVSPIEFGFEDYARARLSGYFAWRDELLKLLEQDPPPASPIPSRHSSGDKSRAPPPPLAGIHKLSVT